jgi:GT2 family glycosyltransferase
MTPLTDRLSLVVLTFRRPHELERCIEAAKRLPEQPQLIVVDNGADESAAQVLRSCRPRDLYVKAERNMGAAARNLGVARAHTPYVAFCDDDCQWMPGSLARAVELMDAHPRIAAIAARVLVGTQDREDPTCASMQRSPLRAPGLPGPRLIGFMAGAVVMRAQAFRAVGGYEPRLFLGGEEQLMAFDLAELGWDIVYAQDVLLRHEPSPRREMLSRNCLVLRNRIWVAWLRLRAASALKETLYGMQEGLRRVPRSEFLYTLGRAAGGARWVLSRRRVVSVRVEDMLARVRNAERLGRD